MPTDRSCVELFRFAEPLRIQCGSRNRLTADYYLVGAMSCVHAGGVEDGLGMWQRLQGHIDQVAADERLDAVGQNARCRSDVGTAAQHRTARRSDRTRGNGCCGAKQMRQPWPAPGGLQRLADHGERCGPCITSRQLERSTDHTGRSGLSQCGQHTHSTASVVSVPERLLTEDWWKNTLPPEACAWKMRPAQARVRPPGGSTAGPVSYD
jgi:hypothetical protein